jgi:hypothetical protein
MRGLHVHAHDLVYVFVRELRGRPRDATADVVYPDVYVSEVGKRLRHHAANVRAAGHVAHHGERPVATLARHGLERFAPARDQHYGRSSLRKKPGHRRPDPAAGASNHNDPVEHLASDIVAVGKRLSFAGMGAGAPRRDG